MSPKELFAAISRGLENEEAQQSIQDQIGRVFAAYNNDSLRPTSEATYALETENFDAMSTPHLREVVETLSP